MTAPAPATPSKVSAFDWKVIGICAAILLAVGFCYDSHNIAKKLDSEVAHADTAVTQLAAYRATNATLQKSVDSLSKVAAKTAAQTEPIIKRVQGATVVVKQIDTVFAPATVQDSSMQGLVNRVALHIDTVSTKMVPLDTVNVLVAQARGLAALLAKTQALDSVAAISYNNVIKTQTSLIAVQTSEIATLHRQKRIGEIKAAFIGAGVLLAAEVIFRPTLNLNIH